VQDVARRVLVAVKCQPAAGAHVGPHAERFLHPRLACCAIGQDAATVLRRECRRHGKHGNASDPAVIAQPAQKQAPGGIADALRELAIPDRIGLEPAASRWVSPQAVRRVPA
jgi:hypothetical protein